MSDMIDCRHQNFDTPSPRQSEYRVSSFLYSKLYLSDWHVVTCCQRRPVFATEQQITLLSKIT